MPTIAAVAREVADGKRRAPNTAFGACLSNARQIADVIQWLNGKIVVLDGIPAHHGPMHTYLTDGDVSPLILMSAAFLAADHGVPAHLPLRVLNAALVEFDGLPGAQLYAARILGEWQAVSAAEAHAQLRAGRLVIAA